MRTEISGILFAIIAFCGVAAGQVSDTLDFSGDIIEVMTLSIPTSEITAISVDPLLSSNNVGSVSATIITNARNFQLRAGWRDPMGESPQRPYNGHMGAIRSDNSFVTMEHKLKITTESGYSGVVLPDGIYTTSTSLLLSGSSSNSLAPTPVGGITKTVSFDQPGSMIDPVRDSSSPFPKLSYKLYLMFILSGTF